MSDPQRGLDFFSNCLGRVLREFIAASVYHLVVIAPYIKAEALKSVLRDLDSAVELTVVTKWSVAEVLAGVSDTDVFDIVNQRSNSRLLLHPRLHAKLFTRDYQTALVGSANVTRTALGLVENENLEVLVQSPATAQLLLIIERILSTSVVATADFRDEIDRAAKEAALHQPDLPSIIEPSLPARPQEFFLPQLRTPERLYRAYQDPAELPFHQIPQALADLAALGGSFPAESAEVFNSSVSEALKNTPVVRELYCEVTNPRRFGELTNWLQTLPVVPPIADRTAAQRRLQTLLRWIIFYLPQHFELQRPKHTEILHRVSSTLDN